MIPALWFVTRLCNWGYSIRLDEFQDSIEFALVEVLKGAPGGPGGIYPRRGCLPKKGSDSLLLPLPDSYVFLHILTRFQDIMRRYLEHVIEQYRYKLFNMRSFCEERMMTYRLCTLRALIKSKPVSSDLEVL
jgi:hypothetical protein